MRSRIALKCAAMCRSEMTPPKTAIGRSEGRAGDGQHIDADVAMKRRELCHLRLIGQHLFRPAFVGRAGGFPDPESASR